MARAARSDPTVVEWTLCVRLFDEIDREYGYNDLGLPITINDPMGMVTRPEASRRNELVDLSIVSPELLLALAPDWPRFLAKDLEDADRDIIRAGERTGRPLGSKRFVAQLEERLDRVLARRRPGPKAKEETSLWS